MGLGVVIDQGTWLEEGRLLGCAYPWREAAVAGTFRQRRAGPLAGTGTISVTKSAMAACPWANSSPRLSRSSTSRSAKACRRRGPPDEPPSLFRQRHYPAHRPPRPVVVALRVEGTAEAGYRAEAAEAAYLPSAAIVRRERYRRIACFARPGRRPPWGSRPISLLCNFMHPRYGH